LLIISLLQAKVAIYFCLWKLWG